MEKYREEKLKELRKLEGEYQNALMDVGLGHAEVERELGYLRQKDENQIRQREVAEVRGEHALKVEAHKNSLKEKLIDEKKNLIKSVKLMEDTRAAKLRNKKEIVSKVSVVEIPMPQEELEKRVRFSDSAKETSGVIVRAYDKVADKIGVEDAIREEMDRRQETIEQRNIARNRNQAALKRSQMSKPVVTESFFEESTTPESDNMDDIDVAMSMETNFLTDSSESSSLHATIHQENRQEPKFTSDYGLIQGVVVGQAVDHSSPKAPKAHQDFVAKVLDGMEMPTAGDLQVSVKIDEVSTFASSVTSVESPQTSSSSDITKEKFLSEAWKTQDIRGLIGEFRSKQSSPGQSQLKGKSCVSLDCAARTTLSMKPKSHVDFTYLIGYIQKLLEMKREEIENLSVATESSVTSPSSSSVGHDSTPIASSTPSSILSSGSSRGSKNKSVRFIDQPDNTPGAVGGSFLDTTSKDEKKRKDILRKTRLSLEKVRTYYEHQRLRLEAELEKRQANKLIDKENVSPVSEGPLSTSSPSSSSSTSSSSFEVRGLREVRTSSKAKSVSRGTFEKSR